jgi:hypothetical protein
MEIKQLILIIIIIYIIYCNLIKKSIKENFDMVGYLVSEKDKKKTYKLYNVYNYYNNRYNYAYMSTSYTSNSAPIRIINNENLQNNDLINLPFEEEKFKVKISNYPYPDYSRHAYYIRPNYGYNNYGYNNYSHGRYGHGRYGYGRYGHGRYGYGRYDHGRYGHSRYDHGRYDRGRHGYPSIYSFWNNKKYPMIYETEDYHDNTLYF